MVAQLESYVLDFGLDRLDTRADYIYICANEPSTYALATTGSGTSQALGFKSWGVGNAFGSPASASASSRKVSSVSITDGTITTNGTAAWWAAVDTGSAQLLAHGQLSGTQAVTAGNTFTLAVFDITVFNR